MNNKLLERVSMPTIATSLSFDSLMEISQESPRDLVIIGEDSEEGGGSVSSRSRGRSQEWRHDIEGGEEGEGEEEGEGKEEQDEEVTLIRAANLLQRSLYVELERLKLQQERGGGEGPVCSEHPMLQGEVRSPQSEVLANGELRSKAIPAAVTWQESFSLYLQRRRGEDEGRGPGPGPGPNSGRGGDKGSTDETATATLICTRQADQRPSDTTIVTSPSTAIATGMGTTASVLPPLPAQSRPHILPYPSSSQTQPQPPLPSLLLPDHLFTIAEAPSPPRTGTGLSRQDSSGSQRCEVTPPDMDAPVSTPPSRAEGGDDINQW
jgi:hypothetical protein